jgi:non-ribosomal peptide synthetase component E (peptide arylation enzyme)
MVTPLAIADLIAAVENGATVPPVQRISIFGAITAKSLFARAEAAFHAPIAIKLGTSETGQTSYGLIDAESYGAGWSGRPISTVEIKIDGAEPGDAGRMFVRETPRIGAEGYLGGEPMFDADGWFDTGDVARILPDGNLLIEGRADNLINLDGSKIAAELVEMLACQYADVSTAAAVRLRDPDTGKVALGVAVVADPAIDLAGLEIFLSLKLRLRTNLHLRKVSALPMLGSGKLDRSRIIGLFE